MQKYNCPKCRCGCMFEEKNKLICLNCGAEVPKIAASGVRHSHHYHTYTKGSGTKPVCIRPSQPAVRPAPVRPASTGPIKVGNARENDPKKRKGCGFWILLYFGLFWLLPVLFELISDLF